MGLLSWISVLLAGQTVGSRLSDLNGHDLALEFADTSFKEDKTVVLVTSDDLARSLHVYLLDQDLHGAPEETLKELQGMGCDQAIKEL